MWILYFTQLSTQFGEKVVACTIIKVRKTKYLEILENVSLVKKCCISFYLEFDTECPDLFHILDLVCGYGNSLLFCMINDIFCLYALMFSNRN